MDTGPVLPDPVGGSADWVSWDRMADTAAREHSARKISCARAKLAAANTAEWWTRHGGPRTILPFTPWVEHSPVVELIGTVSHSHVLRAS